MLVPREITNRLDKLEEDMSAMREGIDKIVELLETLVELTRV